MKDKYFLLSRLQKHLTFLLNRCYAYVGLAKNSFIRKLKMRNQEPIFPAEKSLSLALLMIPC